MASRSSEIRAEPNLTPLLDVVFQLITFFMLVINFSTENFDKRVRLPVAESARPIESQRAVAEDRLVLNVDQDGHLLIGGEAQPINKATLTIKHEADLVRLNLKAIGKKVDAVVGLPTTIVLRADKDTRFDALKRVIDVCQSQGFRKFSLKAMTRGES
jgi:biopolymer transport protein ExbD